MGTDTAKKVPGSIPDGVIGILHKLNRLGRAMALRSNMGISCEVETAGV
jgi:hypothetical protein